MVFEQAGEVGGVGFEHGTVYPERAFFHYRNGAECAIYSGIFLGHDLEAGGCEPKLSDNGQRYLHHTLTRFVWRYFEVHVGRLMLVAW
jgi:hypothetical protein